jgi:hypothetical protein
VNIFSKLLDKLYLKQWTIGIANIEIKEIIRDKKINSSFTWIPIKDNYTFFADPFICKTEDGKYQILYEELDYKKQYGNISLFTINEEDQLTDKRVLLDTKSHLSYPFIFFENNKIYVFPESSAASHLVYYEFDQKNYSLSLKKSVLDLPVLDSTILKHQNKYWIFCTMRSEDSNSNLFIFYSENLFGPYVPHKKNPVKDDINGARPAGNFIKVAETIYRPAQASGKYYGSAINIFKIKNLSEESFEEEFYMSIKPDKKEKFNFGIHTINGCDGKIVIDGLARTFSPVVQLKTFLNKKLKVSG